MHNDGKMIGGAVKVALRQLNVDWVSRQDYEDLRQEAVLALWKTAGRFENEEEQQRYSFGAAIREVKKAYFEQLLGRGPKATCLIEDIDIEQVGIEEEKELSPEIIEALAEIFIAARVQQKGRAREAAWRDVIICAMLYAGHNNKSIGLALDTSEDNVRKYRQKIREILNQYGRKGE